MLVKAVKVSPVRAKRMRMHVLPECVNAARKGSH